MDFARYKQGTVIIGAALSLSSTFTVVAAEPDTSQWECARCVTPQGWAMDLEIGPAYVDEDAYRFGDFTGMEEKGVYLFTDLFAQYWGEETNYWRIDAQRLGLDSRAINIEGGSQGAYQLGLFYREVPRFHFNTGETPYRGVGTTDLTLPAGWVRGSNTSGMSALDGALQSAPISSQREDSGLRLRLTPTPQWRFDANYKHTEKEGTDVFGGSFFINAAQLIQPVDYKTDEVTLQAQYARDRWNISLGYLGSFFSNPNEMLEWENAYTSSNGADSGRAALAPDNSAQRLMLSGALRLPAKTTVSGQLSVGRMEQDEALLPYTTNTSLSPAALPTDSANTKVNTTNADLRIRSTALARWVLSGKFSYDERDNKTPQYDFDYVVTDENLATDTVQNTRYSHERTEYELGADYDLAPRQRVNMTYQYEKYLRDNQEVGRSESNRFQAKYINRAADDFDLRITAFVDDRDNSDYQTLSDPDPQNPLMRKYNQADRERLGVKFQSTWLPTARSSVGLHVEVSKDDYSESLIGLQDSNRKRFGLNGSWSLSSKTSLYGSLNYENLESVQANSSTFSNPNWNGETDDRFIVASLGLQWPRLSNNWGMLVDYSYAQSDGDITMDVGGLRSGFPTLETRFHQLRLAFDYRYNDRLSMRFGYGYERYDAQNWALDDVEPDTVTNLLALGNTTQDYDVNLFYITLRYRFGPENRSFQK